MSATEASAATSPPAATASGGATWPYAPSWLNILLAWIDRLPGPTWAAYAVLAVIGIVVGHAGLWAAGVLPWWQLDAAQTFWGIYLPAQLWVIEYLDRVAREAFRTFRSAIDIDDAEARRTLYRLTVTPAWPALAIGIAVLPITLLGYALDPDGSGVRGYSTGALALRAASEWFVGGVLLVFVYHTIRQLRLVSELHARATRVDLFQPRALYAFSQLTSRTGIALLGLIGSGLAANPVALESAVFWTIWAPWLVGVPVLAIVVFAAPLYGMRRRLANEKEAILQASDDRLRSIMGELNAASDARDVARAEGLQKLLASQMQQREVYARLSTWPWSTATLRTFGSALLLPIVIFLIQRYLTELLPR